MGENWQPTFSIVIPTYGRPRQLSQCLQSLARLDYPRDRYEVVIVDDGSKLSLDTVVAPFRDALAITLLCRPHAGPASARQAGIEIAHGDFLAFTDDDCRPAPGWLKVMAAAFEKAPGCTLGGRTLNALTRNVYATASQTLSDYLYTYYNADSHTARFFMTNNMAVPTELFRAMGGLDVTWDIPGGEDRDFCDRWQRSGYRMLYLPEMVVHHYHALTLRTFWRQHFNYGRGALRFREVQAFREHQSFRLEPLSFYFKLPYCAFSRRPRRQASLIALLLVVSQMANALGLCWEKMRKPNHHSGVKENL